MLDSPNVRFNRISALWRNFANGDLEEDEGRLAELVKRHNSDMARKLPGEYLWRELAASANL